MDYGQTLCILYYKRYFIQLKYVTDLENKTQLEKLLISTGENTRFKDICECSITKMDMFSEPI